MIVPDVALPHQIKPTPLLTLENSFLSPILPNIFIALHLNVQPMPETTPIKTQNPQSLLIL